MIEITHWVEGIESQDDFLIEANDIPEIDTVDDKILQYNQWNQGWSLLSCTIFWSVGALSDLMNYEYSLEELRKLNDLSYWRDRRAGKWRWVYKAVDLVRDERNDKHPNNKMLTFRTSIDDKSMVEALNKNHSLVTSYNGNSNYNIDYRSDGKLDLVSFWASTYGHCVRIRKIGGLVHVIDNYNWSTHNIYELADFRELVKNGVFSKWQYIFIPEKKLEKSKEELQFISNLKKIKIINSAIWKVADKFEWYEEVKNGLHDLNTAINKHVE